MKNFSKRKLNSIYSILFIFLAIFLLSSRQLTAVILTNEKILDYEVTIEINKNGSLTVNEVINYQFGNEEFKHGIYRDIPLRSKKNGFDVNKSYVKMNWIKRDGEDEKYKESYFYEGIRYRIGSETELVNLYRTESVYELNYTIYNAVFEKDGIYQIYYNAIGQFWNVPIEQANIVVRFSDDKKIEKNEIQKLEVYTGSYGEKGENYSVSENNGEIHITTRQLEANNGLTFMLNLKTNKINQTFADKLQIIYLSNPAIIFLPILLLFLTIYSIITWKYFGKDPQGKSIIPEFNPPKDISPMFAAYINGERDIVEIMNAGIFSLLSKGFIKASKINNEIKYNKNSKSVYTQNMELEEEERMLLDALSSKKDDIFDSEKSLYNTGEKIIKILKDKYHQIVYKSNNSFLVPFYLATPIFMIFIFSQVNFEDISLFIILYILIMFGSFFYKIWVLVSKRLLAGIMIVAILGIAIYQGIDIFILTSYFVALFTIYAILIGKYTNEGIRKKEYLKGMKMYIRTAEENQIKQFDSINELVKYFNGILPFAVALGVKNEAINLIKKTIKLHNYNTNETYINSRINIHAYRNYNFIGEFSRSYSSGRSKIVSEKFSSSKNRSGRSGGGGFFSGGGFSGGGSGGGGGGSW